MGAPSVVNTLLATLNDPCLRETFLTFVYSDRLEKLKENVATIKTLLLDSANKDDLPETLRDYINKLEEVVYDADDLFDELVTRAEHKKLFDGDNIFEKVHELFSSIQASQKVSELKLTFNDIADDHARFGLGIDAIPHRRLRPTKTFSNVYAPDVVGRRDDANKIIGMLLDSRMSVYYLAIVGIGGVGKTALAKLVFVDKRIKHEFPIRLWVCVSDQDGATLNVKQILLKILESLKCIESRKFYNNGSAVDKQKIKIGSSSVDYLQRQCQYYLQGKKFLLVLDDIWSDKMSELHTLKELLKIDGSVSRIIATTRSKEMARIIGNDTHELEGLSDEHSRQLFETTAFQDGEKPPELVEIGEKIVKKLSNVPLAIMVIGSLLYGQPIDKWQTFLTSGFDRFSKGMDRIMSTLRISYENLGPSLKSCFAYCAIFPKNYVISKEMIINLWNAQGYIVPFDEGQSIEDAGEEHFSVLLQRCFFQDVKKDKFGDVESFKIHDLMHDLAQRVSGKEICAINSSMPDFEYSLRHLSIYSLGCPLFITNSDDFNIKSKIRSFLMLETGWHFGLQFGLRNSEVPSTFEVPKYWRWLRALALQTANVRIPDTIGNLLHLRYLNLANNNMIKLPDSITKLHNLQTLDINYCEFLSEWPKEFSKLVNLTHLYRDGCYNLNCIPEGMSKLSRLHTLNEFAVKDESASGAQHVGQLADLKAIGVNLRGRISVWFSKKFDSTEGYDWEGSCLEGAKHISQVKIMFHFNPYYSAPPQDEEIGGKVEVVMEKLKPHPNLKKFSLFDYAGEKIARWGRAQDNWATFLPNLVRIKVSNCQRLQELPMLSKLQHLKSLSISYMKNLKFVEQQAATSSSSSSSSGSGSLDATFFPSLESLKIISLFNLKRWWKSGDSNELHCQSAFPNLTRLTIKYCFSLRSFPPCLSLPELTLTHNNEELRITTADGVHSSSPSIAVT